MDYQGIVLDPLDNVATVITHLQPGQIKIVSGDNVQVLTILEPVKFGHKVAIKDIPSGTPIRKYGVDIGVSTCAIKTGAWVHTHNVAGQRGRGDQHTKGA